MAKRDVTLKEAAELNGVCPRTLKRWVEREQFPRPAVGLDGTRRRVKFDARLFPKERESDDERP